MPGTPSMMKLNMEPRSAGAAPGKAQPTPPKGAKEDDMTLEEFLKNDLAQRTEEQRTGEIEDSEYSAVDNTSGGAMKSDGPAR